MYIIYKLYNFNLSDFLYYFFADDSDEMSLVYSRLEVRLLNFILIISAAL